MNLQHRVLLIIGLFVGFALRLYRLGAESLWYDETVSIYLARRTIPDLIAHTARDIHPPGYYLFLHLWGLLTQPTIAHGLEFLFAWPSLFFGVLIMGLIYALGSQLYTPHIGLLALWLTAINPFHLWYSQEVRMYTVGAALGLLCFWALLTYQRKGTRQSLLLYAICAALGMYTLYYFMFLLMTLNVIALLTLFTKMSDKLRWYTQWLLAQVGALLIWLPWLPIFWRQATDPPVPPWRVPWQTLPEFLDAIAESLAVFVVGQSSGQPWIWAFITLIVLFQFAYNLRRSQPEKRLVAISLLLYIMLPMLLIYVITLTITPLYHVRYLFTYAPPFALLLALGIHSPSAMGNVMNPVRSRWQPQMIVQIFAVMIILVGSVMSLQRFWFAPPYRADDHRTAVTDLANNWRPGDVILVNAGWVHTILDTYWPHEGDVVPPPLAAVTRLADFNPSQHAIIDAPSIIRTGSVDGQPSLGWGNPNSDFFAISQADTEANLQDIADIYLRIWHFRLYDTVSDPDGAIRTWLETHTSHQQEIAYPGRDYLAVQRYDTQRANSPLDTLLGHTDDNIDFGNALRLQNHVTVPSADLYETGRPIYVQLTWQVLPGLAEYPSDLAMSLRLYDQQDNVIVQQDSWPSLPTSQWLGVVGDDVYAQTLRLGVPRSTAVGTYRLELIVYSQADGVPLMLDDAVEGVTWGQRWRIEEVSY
ncbi:MAG: glycosyltransferase family 39 protein [Chloroflexota bacterium]